MEIISSLKFLSKPRMSTHTSFCAAGDAIHPVMCKRVGKEKGTNPWGLSILRWILILLAYMTSLIHTNINFNLPCLKPANLVTTIYMPVPIHNCKGEEVPLKHCRSYVCLYMPKNTEWTFWSRWYHGKNHTSHKKSNRNNFILFM